MSSLIEAHGFAELDRKLQQIPEAVAREFMAEAMKEGSTIIRDDARARVRVKSGITRRNITVRLRKMASEAVEALIGVGKRWGFRARFIEFGTAPHTIKVKPVGVGAIPKRGLADKERGIFFGKSVHHPGTSPHPFLRPALDAKAQEAVTVMGQSLWRQITARFAQR